MKEKTVQNYASHRKYVPAFHFFVLPVLGLLVPVYAAVHFFRHPGLRSAVALLAAAALGLLVYYCRMFATGNQDRIILLEERLRYGRVLSGPALQEAARLTDGQIIGLRFAADEELAALVSAAVSERLSRNDVKKRVQDWKPDHRRV